MISGVCGVRLAKALIVVLSIRLTFQHVLQGDREVVPRRHTD